MKANELMIKDWVAINKPDRYAGATGQIHSLMYHQEGDSAYFHVFIQGKYGYLTRDVCSDDIRPIPLTPEILEKNGYRRIKGGKVMGLHVADIFDLEISNEYGRYLKIDLQDFGETEATHWYIGIQGRFSFSGYIGYLHQLQHIYRLCGVEKNIEL